MEPLAVITRNGYIESAHCGVICVVDASGKVLFHIGDVYTKIFFRSSAKPIQAIPFVQSGAAQALGLMPQEIAVVCASHIGEKMHWDTVQGILKKLGLNEQSLRCGVSQPAGERERIRLVRERSEPDSLHHCCSGKHAGMLALAKFRGLGLKDYENIAHPVQQEILKTAAYFLDAAAAAIPTAADGCGAPVYLLSVFKAALAYARLARFSQDAAHPYHRACKTIFGAMAAYPAMVAGEGIFDTELMRAAQGSLIGKSGYEGVYCLALAKASLGVCIKIADGGERAIYPAVMQVLKDLDILDKAQWETLSRWHTIDQKNSLGQASGALSPYFSLSQGSFCPAPLGRRFP